MSYRQTRCGIVAARAVLVSLGVLNAHPVCTAQTQLTASSAQGRSAFRGEITPALRLAVSRGFEHLIREQKRTRGFSDEFPVAVNALVGLAFLAGGYTDDTGPRHYVQAIRDATSRLLKCQKTNGYFDDGGKSRMYGHGFATLYLAELYGMSRLYDHEIRDALRRAIRLIEKSQSTDGGWDYHPATQFGVARKITADTSITVCQTMALRAARNLGLEVNADTIRAAERYIRSAQNDDGGFKYRSHGFYLMSASTLPRSAAGVCILYSLGDYRSPGIRKGIRYVYRHYRDRNHFPFYANYYASQAMYQVGHRYWREYFQWVREELLDSQRPNGGWRPRFGSIETSPAQCTAMALIVLQLPYRFLPIHER